MLDTFFSYGALPANAEKGTYIPLLVLASYLVAVFGSYMGLTLAVQLFGEKTGTQKQIVSWTGAFALGIGIWSMHFIGMLAYKMRMVVDYDPGLTILSMLIAITVAWFVMRATLAETLSPLRLAVSALLLGCGISAMHYTGMAAMQMRAGLRYMPSLFFLSVAIAVFASGAALWIIFTLGRHSGRKIFWKIIAALVMGAAICGMHYTGMAAAVFTPYPDCAFDANQNFDILAIAVIVLAGLLLLGIFIFSISQRLFLLISCATLFALPLVLTVYQAIGVLNENIRKAEKERYGVEYHSHLINVLQRAQEVRGYSYSVRNGEKSLIPALRAQKQELEKEIAATDAIDQRHDEILASKDGWWKVRANILASMQNTRSPAPDREFRDYSDAIERLDDFMLDLSDDSNMTDDPDLDAKYLEDATISTGPSIMQIIGKMRGLMSGLIASGRLPPQWSEAQTRELQSLYNELEFADEDMSDALERARRADADSAPFGAYHDAILKPKLEDLQKHFARMIFAHENDLPAAEIFRQATALIDLYDALYDKTADAFLDLTKHRHDDYALKRNLVLYSSIAAFLGFFALFVFLYRTLEKTARAERAASSASHAKSEFLANMSHELRTPLNSILGMNRLLLDSAMSKAQTELAQTMFRSSVNLLEIVNDILDLSKIEAGEMKLEHIGFDPHYVFHGVVHAMDHIAREKKLSIVRHYEKEKLPYLVGDPTRFGRVLMNLIGNAVKYTHYGQVDVRVSCQPIDDGHVMFRGEVSDTGIGIAKEKLKSIFEKFVQADTSTTRKYGGTGLGLAITKHLVELMGGTIGVTSEIGTGSTFWFEIPFEITDKLHEEKYIRRQKANLGTLDPATVRILVAEDHPLNQIFITKLLQKFGVASFHIVETGVAAVLSYAKEPWDIVLMDCHMPEKNGYDATVDIRTLEKSSGKHVPIVAMTANAMVGDREKCLRYGMDDYISKPISADELKEVLGQWIDFKKIAAGAKAASTPRDDETLDLALIRSFAEGDSDLEKQMAQIFITQSDQQVEKLAHMMQAGDDTGWSETGHLLKGGAAGIGARRMADLCNQAQHLSGEKTERAALYKEIKEEYMRVKEQLKKHGLT